MSLERLDRIVFRNQDEIKRLLQWRDMNKDLVRNYHPVLNEGLIEFNGLVIHFKQTHEVVNYEAIVDNKTIFKMQVVLNGDGTYAVLNDWFHPAIPAAKHIEYRQDVATIHMSLMAYMEHYVEHVENRRETVSVAKKARHGEKKSKNRSVKIGRKVYTVDVPEKILTEKRKYERHTESWSQRGHWRHYKSGKVTWVKAHVKGNKDKNPDPKNYHI